MGSTDSHKNAEIRGLIAPLAALAAKHRVAVVLVTHLNKSGHGPAIYRSIGSIAFAAASRATWAVIKDPENDQRRLMLPVKNNLAPDTMGMAYSIQADGAGSVPFVAWEPDPVNLSADDAMYAASGKDDKEDEDLVKAWLREALKDGPMPAREVLDEGRANGFSAKALHRAPTKRSCCGFWTQSWSLPNCSTLRLRSGRTTPGVPRGRTVSETRSTRTWMPSAVCWS